MDLRFADYSELAESLSLVSYKPGWEFRLYAHEHEGIWIAISFEVPDRSDSATMQRQCVRSPVPPIPVGEYFNHWLMWRLRRIESHEMCEFFTVGDQRFSDPHRAGANDG